jgi:AcrR family transcriptional regulator
MARGCGCVDDAEGRTRAWQLHEALYRHVRDRDELLVLLLDRAAGELPRPRLPREPRRRLLVLFKFLYDGLDRSPWVVPVLVKGDLMAPSVLWLTEEIVAAFVAAGMTPPFWWRLGAEPDPLHLLR